MRKIRHVPKYVLFCVLSPGLLVRRFNITKSADKYLKKGKQYTMHTQIDIH